jgi:voltage-gated potassium channel
MAQARGSTRLAARRLVKKDAGPWRRLRWALGLFLLIHIYGVIGYMTVEDWSFIDSTYMVLLTLTSVGFKEVHPLSDAGKLFTMSLLALGVGIAVITLSLAARSIAEGGLGERSRRRRMSRRIGSMSNHYIICAYGRVGRTVASEFATEGAEFVVIDADHELEEDMIEDGVAYIVDDPTHEEVLLEAGIERARGLVCAMDSDAANVFVALMARSLNEKIFIVARAAEETSMDRLYRAGANRVISPYVTSARHMALYALRSRVVDYLDVGVDDSLGLRVEELFVEAHSPLVGQTLAQATEGTTALAVRHADGRIETNPPDELELGPGDLLIVLGERDALRVVEGD